MKKIYIAGCGGMLGEGFHHVFEKKYSLRCTDIDVNESWLSYLDFRDLSAYRKDVRSFSPNYLVHLGAHTDLEYCEKAVDDAYLTNTVAVENAVLIANELDIPLIYISTAGIFDGKKDEYDDWDIPNPLGHYGRSKYLGELQVSTRVSDFLVCRAGWMMGGGPNKDKKFIQKLMGQIKSGSKELFVVDDKFGTPTYTHDFARNVELLIQENAWGLYNLVCSDTTSRLEVAKELLSILGMADSIEITAVSSNYFKSTYFAPRPDSERLLNKKLDLRNMNRMRDWKTALREYLVDYYGTYF
jgi:dTDP-4-dehydrorhamnose reductase